MKRWAHDVLDTFATHAVPFSYIIETHCWDSHVFMTCKCPFLTHSNWKPVFVYLIFHSHWRGLWCFLGSIPLSWLSSSKWITPHAPSMASHKDICAFLLIRTPWQQRAPGSSDVQCSRWHAVSLLQTPDGAPCPLCPWSHHPHLQLGQKQWNWGKTKCIQTSEAQPQSSCPRI